MWCPVEIGEKITHNLDLYPIMIKTAAVLEINSKISIAMKDADNKFVGLVRVVFSHVPYYRIDGCIGTSEDDSVQLADLKLDAKDGSSERLWTFSKLENSFIIKCSGEVLVDFQFSNSLTPG